MEREPFDAQWAPPPLNRPEFRPPGLALPADAPTPPALPRRRRRRGRLALGAVLCTVLAVVAASLATAQFRADRGPGAVAGQYFRALAAGDAPVALALARPRPDSLPSRDYLTTTVLKQQLAIAPLTDITVRGTTVQGATATVQLGYRLGFRSGSQQIDDAVNLIRSGSTWQVSRPGTALTVSAVRGGTNRLAFAGRPVPDHQVQLFPGALPLSADSPSMQPDGQPLIRFIDEGQATNVTASLTPAASSQLLSSLRRAVAACLSGASKDPHCPAPDTTRPIPGSLRGAETRPVPADLALSTAADGRIELTNRITVAGSWQTWNFNNQAVKHSGNTQVNIEAEATVSDLNTIYWVAS